MTRKCIFIFSLLIGLIAISCKNTDRQDKEASRTTTNTKVEKENAKANTSTQIFEKPEVPVLCYHRITEGKKGDYTVSPATFASHMKILADSGFHSISPAQLYDYLVYNKDLPKKPVMITFDDSRAEHSEIAAPVMEKHGFRGVFFIMTITYNKKNYMTKDQIAGLAKVGHTIGLHTWDHTMVTKFKEDADWQKQIADPKEKLEQIVGKPVEYFAYPNGVYDHKGAEELSKFFKLSFTLFSKRDSIKPLQTVRRILATECSGQSLLKSMKRAFKTK
jgi:peptidoglycan/xylan/chitin deacetylase (PgdA/CDA1 family)